MIDDITVNIPVIAVSAYAMDQQIEQGKTVGFSDYITKPFDLVKLQSTINNFISKAG